MSQQDEVSCVSPQHMNGTFSDQDRLQMFENLDKAEGRIFALEKEVSANWNSFSSLFIVLCFLFLLFRASNKV